MLIKEIEAFLQSRSVDFEYFGSDDLEIVQVADLGKAKSNELSFFNDPKLKEQLASTQAGLVILKSENAALTLTNRLIVKDPYYVYAILAQKFNPLPYQPGVHPNSVIHPSVQLPESCAIGPFVVIGENVSLGERICIEAGCVIESGVTIGEDCRLGPNVTIMQDCVIGSNVAIHAGCVIGGDGFGWAPIQGRWERIPQIGRVIIGNGVSIGNNTAIDRGALQDTVIEDNCIIDNLVHISHNVRIGQGSAIAAQNGIAGSTEIGKHCIMAGQGGVAGHISIADKVVLMAKAGVTHSIKESGSYSGFPAVPTAEWQKNMVRSKNLNKMALQIKALEKQITELQKQLEEK